MRRGESRGAGPGERLTPRRETPVSHRDPGDGSKTTAGDKDVGPEREGRARGAGTKSYRWKCQQR